MRAFISPFEVRCRLTSRSSCLSRAHYPCGRAIWTMSPLEGREQGPHLQRSSQAESPRCLSNSHSHHARLGVTSRAHPGGTAEMETTSIRWERSLRRRANSCKPALPLPVHVQTHGNGNGDGHGFFRPQRAVRAERTRARDTRPATCQVRLLTSGFCLWACVLHERSLSWALGPCPSDMDRYAVASSFLGKAPGPAPGTIFDASPAKLDAGWLPAVLRPC